MKYIIIFQYHIEGIYLDISFVPCASLTEVEKELERIKSKYRIASLMVFPISSMLTQYQVC